MAIDHELKSFLKRIDKKLSTIVILLKFLANKEINELENKKEKEEQGVCTAPNSYLEKFKK